MFVLSILTLFLSFLLNHSFEPISRNVGIKNSLLRAIVKTAPYEDIIPFLSEHIQPSDQLLFVGAKTDLAIQLAKNGYGSKKTGVMVVVDSDQSVIDECISLAKSMPETAGYLTSKKLSFICCDLDKMASICRQSSFDAIVDYGGLDSLLKEPSANEEKALKAIDHMQNALRLGNILVCISALEKNLFCSPFEKRFGWVQELDGDPGEISAWYR